MNNVKDKYNHLIMHIVLLSYTLICIFPVYLLVNNSFKKRRAIFKEPLSLPTEETFSLVGFTKMFSRVDFSIYFFNSTFVTLTTLFLVLLFGAMAAWALSEYKFKGNTMLGLYLAFGIMLPIKLGTVSILQLLSSMNLVNTLTGLVIVYTAQSLPLAIWILTEFMKQVNQELKEAARCDGVNEYQLFFYIILPLMRPPLATVASSIPMATPPPFGPGLFCVTTTTQSPGCMLEIHSRVEPFMVPETCTASLSTPAIG